MQTESTQGLSIPGLEILRPLGHGHAADVYLARELALKRLVALKIVHSALQTDPTVRLRFEREASAVAALTHPGVVQVYRAGETGDGRPYLVMQYVEGRSLEDRLAAEGPLAVDEAKRILTQVAEALKAAHKRGIVHRDLRPANVLQDEETGRVLLTDFGLAALLDTAERPAPRLTRAGQILGDARFMSPEQVRGEKVTGQADVYQLGVLAYYLLANEGPFGTMPPARLMSAHLKDEPQELTSLRRTVDPDLAERIARCLSKEPAKRPTPGDLVRWFGEHPSRPEEATSASVEALDLLRRRIPHFVAAAVVVGGALLGAASQLTQHNILPEIAYPLALILVVHAVVVTAVLSWFHGARGEQKVEPFEIATLTAVAASWVAWTVWMIL